MIPNEKDSEDTLLNALCYAVQYMRTKRCSDEEPETDLRNQLFSFLKALKEDIILSFNYQSFEKKCFIINTILIIEKYFFRIYELRIYELSFAS